MNPSKPVPEDYADTAEEMFSQLDPANKVVSDQEMDLLLEEIEHTFGVGMRVDLIH